jgi:hypothetical protein
MQLKHVTCNFPSHYSLQYWFATSFGPLNRPLKWAHAYTGKEHSSSRSHTFNWYGIRRIIIVIMNHILRHFINVSHSKPLSLTTQAISMELSPWDVSSHKGILNILRNAIVHFHDHNSYGEVSVAQPQTLGLVDHFHLSTPAHSIYSELPFISGAGIAQSV